MTFVNWPLTSVITAPILLLGSFDQPKLESCGEYRFAVDGVWGTDRPWLSPEAMMVQRALPPSRDGNRSQSAAGIWGRSRAARLV
jgi:hypothetical protein